MEQTIDIRDVLRQAMHQIKLEEISNWLKGHNSVLFYNHEKGFTVVSKQFIDEHPEIKESLNKLLKIIDKDRNKQMKKATEHTEDPELSYMG